MKLASYVVTDGALALGVDLADAGTMNKPPRPRGEGVITRRMWFGIFFVGVVIAAGTLLVLDASLPGGLIEGSGTMRYAQTMAFTTLVFFQLFTVFNARSDERSAFVGLFSNNWLWGAVLLSLLLQAAVRAEELQSRMTLGEYLPQAGVGVSGLYMKLDEGKDGTLGMVFATVSIPISGWWEASHTLKERSYKEQMAENALKENSELLLLEMEKAWQDLTVAYRQVLLNEEVRRQAEENLKVNRDSYANGLSNLSDLLDAQAALQLTKDQVTGR
jgi:hypothetical protein